MHELSIALEVCRMAEDTLGRAALPTVIAVGLEVGDRAGIEIANLEFCLEALLDRPPFAGARPVIDACAGDVLRLSYLEVDDDGPHD